MYVCMCLCGECVWEWVGGCVPQPKQAGKEGGVGPLYNNEYKH